ncbi:putative mitochondrial protein [Vitis vinifera]|uniref:Putative mitochondrial protein n=1 Tax=Vitis vinifera TaxID=29760 RepID=A0A438FTD6_VITVI|nr:putative mitochondrial protein [Vitis vinifera]
MSGSNVEKTSEQTRGREIEPTARSRDKKDKSRDAVANMEARLAKVELAMADTREGLDLIEQGMEKGLEDLREQIQDLRERVLVSQVQPVSHEEFVSFQGKVLSMLASMESRIEALATRMESRDQEVRQELAIYKAAVSARVMATQEASRVEVPKPHRFSGNRDAKELDNFLWHMERYFEAIALTDEAAKVRTATLYLTDTATLWWRRRFADMEKGICTIETWEDFKREIKRQFYPEDVAYLARKNMRRLKHTGSIREYVKEFSSLMLEIPNMTEEELLFNFMDNLQGWAEQELRRRGVQDLATAMAVAESLIRGETPPRLSLLRIATPWVGETRFQETTMLLKMDQARRLTSEKEGKALSAMIEEREQEDEAHMGSMQLLGALQFNPKPSTPETSILAGVQVKEEKGERAEVARTYMEEVTKGKVNSMGKRKLPSKHRKRTGLHPSEASREKEVKNILAERVTRRQGVLPVIEYLVRWKGLPKRQEEGSFWRLLEPSTLSHWWEECGRSCLPSFLSFQVTSVLAKQAKHWGIKADLARSSVLTCLILVNGSAKGWVKASRGLRQGDPLSPFLFTLVADVLSGMLLRANERNMLEGFRILKSLLLVFGHISGLKVNLDKSNIYGINLDQVHLSRLAEMLDCKASGWPILYPGLPLGGNPRRIGEGKRDYLVRWDVVCRPKAIGGFGFGNISQRNLALLGKWLWSQMVTSLSLEGYCTSLLGIFLVYSVCGRKWGKNSVLGRFVVFPSKFVWNSQVPFKVKSFVWLVAHKKVNTNDMLQVRRLYKALSPDICILCMKHGESADHLFLHCSLTIGLWHRLFQLAKMDWVPRGASLT